MDGIAYEAYCATYLRRHGYRRVALTRAGGDQGLDIIAIRHGVRTGFQCKYYNRPVGNHAVQEAYAGMRHYGCAQAVVITNSTFTSAAETLAASTGVILWPGICPPAYPALSRAARWFCLLAGLAMGVCGAILLLSPDSAAPLRQAGALCLICAFFSLFHFRAARWLQLPAAAAAFALCARWQAARPGGFSPWLCLLLLPGAAALFEWINR